MRNNLDYWFPGWSWEGAGLQFLGSEWVVATGHLIVIDENLIAMGVIPPIRKYYGAGAARIQYKSGLPREPVNIIDIDKHVKTANSNALKIAINRLCHIGDDIYGKRVDEEGASSMATYIEKSIMDSEGGQQGNALATYLQQSPKILPSRLCTELGIKNITDISDYKAAYKAAQKLKGVE